MTRGRPLVSGRLLAIRASRRPLASVIDSDKHNNFRLLRLIAAAMVVETHSHLILPGDRDYFTHFHISFLGLPSFFFLSGLLVAQSLYHSSSWKSFLWKRVLRIYPAACFSLLTCALIIGPLVTSFSMTDYFSSAQLYHFLSSCSLFHTFLLLPGVFTHSVLGTPSVNSSLWTVSMELKLYIGVLLTWPIPAAWKRWVLPPLIIALILYSTWPGQQLPGYLQPWMTYGVQFLTGALCFHFRDHIIIHPVTVFLLPPLIFLSLWLHIWLYTAYLLIPALVICTGAFAVRYIKRITPKPDLSYGVYVFAFPIQQCVANYLHPQSPLQFFILSMMAVCPMALLSWYVVEKNALRLKGLVR